MKTRTLRRLEALEDHRLREQRALSSWYSPMLVTWWIVLGWYLGDLKKQDLGRPMDAYARALGYPSGYEYHHAFTKMDRSEIVERHHDAYRRLFAKVGLDFDATPRSVLFDAFIRMVNELPDEPLNWLKSEFGSHAVTITSGTNLPRGITADNFLYYF
jgi:hypothetical protein